MNKETRIKKISEIIERDKANPYGKQDIPWEDVLKPMDVYKIPLEYLVYNKYNGRILSRTKSLESQGKEIDVETDAGKQLVEKLLMESNPSRNRQTLESITNLGQEKVGIITKDGIIIDGNRRAMLLRRSGKYDYFKTAVLDVTLEENPTEIEKLETIYQMGEDEKLGYNAIEKYLKAKGLRQRNISEKKIGEWMGETDGTIEEYLAVMKTMDDYLDYLGYNGVYTQLDGREDPFISLTKWTKNFYGEGSAKAFDGYRDTDVDDLKLLAYDYIRVVRWAQYEGKEFRIIADGLKENHFFGNKAIWDDFRDFHFSRVQAAKDSEERIDFGSDNLKAHLDDRDKKFFEKTKNGKVRSFLDENLDAHQQQLRYKKSANEPLKLADDAAGALDAIDQGHRAASAPEVLDKITKINEKTFEILRQKAPTRLLDRVIEILKSIEFKSKDEEEDRLLANLKEIGSLAYRLEKELKKSR
jgi:hypothetical protein